MNLIREHVEQISELCSRQMRRLCAGPDVNAAIIAPPCNGTVGLHVRMLDLLGVVASFIDRVGLCKASFHIAYLTLDLHENVVLGILNTGLRASSGMQNRSTRLHCLVRIKNRGKKFVIYFDET